ncbi:Uncharacterised protein [Mycobacteroides abscessus subsp. abscessus]|nr:Uncharacterised protein [Mycobacteroides abscessus subsp. abscessus]
MPRSAVVTTSTGAWRTMARSRSVLPPAASSTSRPPAPSTKVKAPGRSRATIAVAICVWSSSSNPARDAEATGARGSG